MKKRFVNLSDHDDVVGLEFNAPSGGGWNRKIQVALIGAEIERPRVKAQPIQSRDVIDGNEVPSGYGWNEKRKIQCVLCHTEEQRQELMPAWQHNNIPGNCEHRALDLGIGSSLCMTDSPPESRYLGMKPNPSTENALR
jgi:hypothetical protein